MQPDTTSESPGSDVTSTVFKDTELTLGLPGEARFSGGKTCSKRGFIETSMDLDLGDSSSSSHTRGKILAGQDFSSESLVSGAGKPSATKRQEVVGWPPVRSLRKRALEGCKYVKVAVDGAPYLRKVDLEIYNSYQKLLRTLEQMFMTCFAIHGNYVGEGERKVMDPMKEMEYVPTYEDTDGDWMLVGDVPWKMFIESCKRIRLMKSSEAVGTLAPRTHPRSCTYNEVAADQQLKAR
ncbi:auxin-responsive protein IAA1-like [Juglans microcarpa x Juglans regia]|uniref:auxin-responsive protein IAA1-like n=1 Tax=Juglans microcarpa x Juglans regia TaxID=2249226 RepID=UPI001B7E5318|nr:auxin-responsive protein IAA1-like [Juglans microcarpa x Juglans regia]